MNLEYWFRTQDRAAVANRTEFQNAYAWLDSAIGLLCDLLMFVNTDPEVQAIRLRVREEDPTRYLATNLAVNLLNDAMGSLVNATRLLLFGAHPDSFALIRSALEACCYVEHFIYHPDKAEFYMEMEGLLSKSEDSSALEINLQAALQKRGLNIGAVLRELEERSRQNARGLYARLCKLGSHPSPKRVGLRLSPPNGAVLAPVSMSTPGWSRANWTRGCASDMTAVAKYAVEMLFDHYPEWFAVNPTLIDRCKSLAHEYELLGDGTPT